MEVSQTVETEEDLLTCLYIKLYHPQQMIQAPYRLLPLGNRKKHSADDPLRVGRDAQACTLALADLRVSRKQLAFQAYRTPGHPDMLFALQNLSQKGRMTVNGAAMGYLERVDLPDKALIRFGEYELLVVRESGYAKACFEVALEVLTVSPSADTGTCVPSMTPITETGMCVPSMTPIMETFSTEMNGLAADLSLRGPSETDETAMYLS